MKLIANPVRLSETPVDYRITAPMLGEHTASVLSELLGMDEAEISALQAKGIV